MLEHRHANALDLGLHAPRPCVLELDAADGGKQVDAIRRQAELRNDVWLNEVLGANAEVDDRSAEVRESGDQPRRVTGRALDPDVQVAGGTRNTVNPQRVRVNHEKSNLRSDQRAKHVAKVVDHAGRGSS